MTASSYGGYYSVPYAQARPPQAVPRPVYAQASTPYGSPVYAQQQYPPRHAPQQESFSPARFFATFCGEAVKEVLSPVTELLKGNPLPAALTAGAIALCVSTATAPIALPLLVGAGVVTGGLQLVSNGLGALSATNAREQEQYAAKALLGGLTAATAWAGRAKAFEGLTKPVNLPGSATPFKAQVAVPGQANPVAFGEYLQGLHPGNDAKKYATAAYRLLKGDVSLSNGAETLSAFGAIKAVLKNWWGRGKASATTAVADARTAVNTAVADAKAAVGTATETPTPASTPTPVAAPTPAPKTQSTLDSITSWFKNIFGKKGVVADSLNKGQLSPFEVGPYGLSVPVSAWSVGHVADLPEGYY